MAAFSLQSCQGHTSQEQRRSHNACRRHRMLSNTEKSEMVKRYRTHYLSQDINATTVAAPRLGSIKIEIAM